LVLAVTVPSRFGQVEDLVAVVTVPAVTEGNRHRRNQIFDLVKSEGNRHRRSQILGLAQSSLTPNPGGCPQILGPGTF